MTTKKITGLVTEKVLTPLHNYKITIKTDENKTIFFYTKRFKPKVGILPELKQLIINRKYTFYLQPTRKYYFLDHYQEAEKPIEINQSRQWKNECKTFFIQKKQEEWDAKSIEKILSRLESLKKKVKQELKTDDKTFALKTHIEIVRYFWLKHQRLVESKRNLTTEEQTEKELLEELKICFLVQQIYG